MVGWLLPFVTGVGVSTGVGVGIRGGNIYEVLGWSALTSGLAAAVGSGAFWRTAWGAVRMGSAPLWVLTKDIAYVGGQTGRAVASTQSARVIAKGTGAVAAGYVLGAVTGTAIVSQAEKKEIVYEGATADVIDFYTGEGHYWEQGADDPTPGYFNIPGNASLIAKHYWNKWR